jgi:hypothetical protein
VAGSEHDRDLGRFMLQQDLWLSCAGIAEGRHSWGRVVGGQETLDRDLH